MIAQAGDTHKPIGKLPAKRTPHRDCLVPIDACMCKQCAKTHIRAKKSSARPSVSTWFIFARFSFLYLIFLSFKSPAEMFFPSKKINWIRGVDDDVLTLFGDIGLISLFLFSFLFLLLSGDVRRFKRDNPAGLSGDERGSDPEKDPAEGGGNWTGANT
jgi:hypothetical protein